MKKPNVILFFVDDLGIGDVSRYNPDSKINTENIDKLAGQGMTFTDAHATSALCTPSRYGLMTGRYNWRSELKKLVHVASEDNLIEEGRMTLATLFKNQGYKTACIGKWHLGMRWVHTGDGPYDVDYSKPYELGPNEFGFDYFYGIQCSLSQAPYVFLENDHAVSVPDTVSGSDNHVLFSSEEARSWFKGPAVSDYDVEQCVPTLQKKVLGLIDEYADGEEPFFIYYPTPAVHVPLLPTKEFVGKSGIGYYGDFVLMTDAMVGEIMDKLEEKGIADDTIFIFTSDNGCGPNVGYPDLIAKGHNPSYIYRGCKGDIYEGGHRIPYIVRYPRMISSGSEYKKMVSLSDIFATLGELLEEKYPDNAGEDSISHLKVWKGGDEPVRDDIVFSSMQGCLSIRKGDWKLEFCPGSGGPTDRINNTDLSVLPEFQLYNMSGDVTERWNMVDKCPEIVGELKQLLIQYIRSGRSTPGAQQKNTGPCHDYWEEIAWING